MNEYDNDEYYYTPVDPNLGEISTTEKISTTSKVSTTKKIEASTTTSTTTAKNNLSLKSSQMTTTTIPTTTEPTSTIETIFDRSYNDEKPDQISIFDANLDLLGHHKYKKLHKHDDLEVDLRKVHKDTPSIFGNQDWKMEKKVFRSGFQAVRQEKRKELRKYQHAVNHAMKKAEKHNKPFIQPEIPAILVGENLGTL